jgi:hypothetical protein
MTTMGTTESRTPAACPSLASTGGASQRLPNNATPKIPPTFLAIRVLSIPFSNKQ